MIFQLKSDFQLHHPCNFISHMIKVCLAEIRNPPQGDLWQLYHFVSLSCRPVHVCIFLHVLHCPFCCIVDNLHDLKETSEVGVYVELVPCWRWKTGPMHVGHINIQQMETCQSFLLWTFFIVHKQHKTLIHTVSSWVHWQTWRRHWGIAIQKYNITEQNNKTRHSTIAINETKFDIRWLKSGFVFGN